MTYPVEPGHGVVYVSAARGHAHQAVCTCGSLGRRRLLWPTIAVVDALLDAVRTGCRPAYPLVWPISVPTAEQPWTWASRLGYRVCGRAQGRFGEICNRRYPVVAEHIYRSLLVLQRRADVRRVYVKPGRNVHWLLTRAGAANASVPDGDIAQAQ